MIVTGCFPCREQSKQPGEGRASAVGLTQGLGIRDNCSWCLGESSKGKSRRDEVRKTACSLDDLCCKCQPENSIRSIVVVIMAFERNEKGFHCQKWLACLV